MLRRRFFLVVGIPCLFLLNGCGALKEGSSEPARTTTKQSPISTLALTRVRPTQTRLLTDPAKELPTPSESRDPIIFFTGDLVSSDSLDRAQKVVALIRDLMARYPGVPMMVASTGDNEQENQPTLEDYQTNFGSTYGYFLKQGIFRPVRGNHDTQDAGHGLAYADYFASIIPARDFPIAAGDLFYTYSYDWGSWHIVGLDQTVGDAVNQASLIFLKADLATHQEAVCQLVYWHVPTYSSGVFHGDAKELIALNQAEYEAGVDIQINGHDHNYQRFFPLDPSGARDDNKGITTFIDGIGGEDDRKGKSASQAQSASAMYLDSFPGGNGNHAIGVIQFVLHVTSADFSLFDANDGSMLDHGTIHCH
jgi:acid phosphatase type 7